MSETAPGLRNPLLAEAEQKIEANIADPAVRADYMKVVIAGMHIGLDKGPDSMLAKLMHRPNPLNDAAQGAVALMLIMRRESRGVMPMKAGIPAAYTLMLHALDFLDSTGTIKIGEAELATASHVFANTLFHKLGITSGMIRHAAGRVDQIIADPTAMEAINRTAGIVRRPDASTPTPLPPSGPPGMINGTGPR